MQEIRYEAPSANFIKQEFFKGEEAAQLAGMQAALLKVEESGARVTNVKRVKIGRNDPCPCGSGNKFKKCCINKAL